MQHAACTILNLQSIKQDQDRILKKIFTRLKSNFFLLNFFGSLVYIIYTKLDKEKLVDRFKKLLYFNRNDRAKGFRYYDLGTCHAIISKDVRFLED
uniref:Uncharacterized protein n=2 Tax=Physcomitrium patens TaxID=3218 RepID=A0A7I3YYK6_PHYPA